MIVSKNVRWAATRVTITNINITNSLSLGHTWTLMAEAQSHQLKLKNWMRGMELNFSQIQNPVHISHWGFPTPCVFPASRRENPAWVLCLLFTASASISLCSSWTVTHHQLCFSMLREKKTRYIILSVATEKALHNLASCVVLL